MPDDGGGRFATQPPGGIVLKLLLTGASGFTGRHLARLADQAGYGVVPLACDLTDPTQVQRAVLDAATDPAQPWAVVHLAAHSFVGHADPLAFYRVNVLGTLHLLDALAALPASQRHSLRAVLLASSATVYGNCTDSPIPETQPPAPVNHYGASKLAMEHLAQPYRERLPLLLTRPFNYTGPGQAVQFVIPKLVQHFASQAPVVELGNLHVQREYNDVDFACQSMLHLLEQGRPGSTYNLCSGQTHSLQQVLERLTQLSGHTLRVQVNPALVRANEIHRLCGDPGRLRSVWQQAGAPWPDAQDMLDNVLTRMLAAARAEG